MGANVTILDVNPARLAYLDDIFPLMAMLEGRCAAEAVRNARTTDIALLQDIHARLEAAARDGRIDAFFEANQEFHKKIQELSGNRWLLSVIQDLRKVLKLSRLHSLSLEGRLQQRYGYAKDQAQKEVNDWFGRQKW